MHQSRPQEQWDPHWPPQSSPRSSPAERLVWLEAGQNHSLGEQASMRRRLEAIEGSLASVHSRIERIGGVTMDAARSLERLAPLAGRVDRMEAAATERAKAKQAAREWRAEQIKLAQWLAILVAALIAALKGAPADVLRALAALIK